MIRNGLISLNLNRLCSPILGQRSQHIIESRFGLNGRICIFRRELAGTAILLLQNIEYIPRFIFIDRSANNDVLLYLVGISGKSFGLTHPFIGIFLIELACSDKNRLARTQFIRSSKQYQFIVQIHFIRTIKTFPDKQSHSCFSAIFPTGRGEYPLPALTVLAATVSDLANQILFSRAGSPKIHILQCYVR